MTRAKWRWSPAIQAKAYGKGLTLLPAAMLARFQHGTVLYNAARGTLTPADLPGKRIGVRSYSQTTGVWMRGILQNDYGVDMSRVQWVTFEDGHVAEAQGSARRDPRASRGKTSRRCCSPASSMPRSTAPPCRTTRGCKSVIADPEAAARDWYAKHRLVPVNHMVVVTDELARARPEAVAELYRLLEAGKRAAGQRRSARHRAVRQGRQPALPRAADVLRGAAEAHPGQDRGRRALVGSRL